MKSRKGLLAAGAAVLLCGASTARAADPAAVAAQAQAAYFTANAPALRELLLTNAAWSNAVASAQIYTYAYLQFRLLQLAVAARREVEARAAGEACIGTLDLAMRREPKSAEIHALRSACYGYLASLGGFAAIRNGSRSGKSIDAALALDARNPRVLLVDGFGLYFRPKFAGGDKLKACARFREAAAAFTAATAPAAGPSWGAPEAQLWMGRCARDAGDTEGARMAFEAALALAPEFAAARRRLGK
jgi:tetratricopeptide (TPR) repeat protein